MRAQKAASCLLAVMLVGCGERIVEPVSTVSVTVERADGSVEHLTVEHAAVEAAMKEAPPADTAGVKIVMVNGVHHVTRFDKLVGTIEVLGDKIITTQLDKDGEVRARYTIHQPQMERAPLERNRDVSLAEADSGGCLFWMALWIASGAVAAGSCATVVGCVGGALTFVNATVTLCDKCPEACKAR